MSTMFKNSEGAQIVFNMIKTIQKHKEFLSEIDGKIGDGDHGINMNKGFSLCGERLTHEDTLDTALEKLGNVLLSEIGGSMGPLYGMYFLAMHKACAGVAHIDEKIFQNMLQTAYDSIIDLGNAKVGDKSLVDTLAPAVDAYNQAVANNKEFAHALAQMDDAAEKGYLSTKDLVAKIGRASRLGDRSKGVLDAGATSCYLLLHSMTETITKILSNQP